MKKLIVIFLMALVCWAALAAVIGVAILVWNYPYESLKSIGIVLVTIPAILLSIAGYVKDPNKYSPTLPQPGDRDLWKDRPDGSPATPDRI